MLPLAAHQLQSFLQHLLGSHIGWIRSRCQPEVGFLQRLAGAFDRHVLPRLLDLGLAQLLRRVSSIVCVPINGTDSASRQQQLLPRAACNFFNERKVICATLIEPVEKRRILCLRLLEQAAQVVVIVLDDIWQIRLLRIRVRLLALIEVEAE